MQEWPIDTLDAVSPPTSLADMRFRDHPTASLTSTLRPNEALFLIRHLHPNYERDVAGKKICDMVGAIGCLSASGRMKGARRNIVLTRLQRKQQTLPTKGFFLSSKLTHRRAQSQSIYSSSLPRLLSS